MPNNSFRFVLFIFSIFLICDLSANEYLVGGRLTIDGKLNPMGNESVSPFRSIVQLQVVPDIRGFDDELETLFGRKIIYIEELSLEKNTALDKNVVRNVLRTYENRKVTLQEFNRLMAQLNKMYVDQGYIYSGVVISRQAIDSGVIRLLAVESKVSKIEIVGNNQHHQKYIRETILNKFTSPLNYQNINSLLYSIQQQLNLKRLAIHLYPGIHVGEAHLKVMIEEKNSARIFLGVDNRRYVPKQETRLFIRYAYYNFSGWGESLDIEWGINEDLSDYAVTYSVPLLKGAAKFSSYFVRSDAHIVETPTDNLISNTYLSGIQLQSDIRVNSQLVLQPMIGLEYKDNTTKSQDGTLGEMNLNTRLIKAGASFEYKVGKYEFIGEFVNYSGLENRDQRNSEIFNLISANLNYSYFFSEDIFRINTMTQYGFDELPYTYKFVTGGSQSFWGNGNEVLASDQAIMVNMKYDYKLSSSNDYQMWLQPFLRVANAGNKNQTLERRASSGLSYKWMKPDKWQLTLTYAFPVEEYEASGQMISRSNVSFSVVYRAY